MSGPRVVAIGGGHGTAVTLRAALRYAGEVAGVVSVADDGGSSGRLRELLDVVALGDLRTCLVAVADPASALARAFEERFTVGELAGLLDTLGDLVAAVDEAGRLLGARGRILPATTTRVDLRATGGEGAVTGQVAVSAATSIERVELVPNTAHAPGEVLEVLARADQIVIGPGSLFTSVLAAAVVPGVAEAIMASSAQRVYVCNLRPQPPETDGFTVADHLAALERHGLHVDVVLYDRVSSMPLGAVSSRVVEAPLAGRNGLVHDPELLCRTLSSALARSW